MKLLLCLPAAFLVACGSGAVSGPPPAPQALNVSPNSAVVYAGQPTAFLITGGVPPYIATSTNQMVVPGTGVFSGNNLTIIPRPVSTPTDVTLIVNDSKGAGISIPLSVRPNLVSSTVSITPTSTQGSCQPAVCSGGDAEVKALLQLDGQPLPGRAVRFEVVSGNFSLVNGSGTDQTTTTTTDAAGYARAIVRIAPAANNQTAILRIVDVESGSFNTVSFTIAQATGGSPGFFISPDSLTFSGSTSSQCANNVSANVYIYGGTPPYSISQPGSAFQVSPGIVGASGEFFTVTPTGVCVGDPGFPVTVTDAAGRSATVLLANKPGTTDAPDLVVSPDTVTLVSCTDIATVTVAGGNGGYTVQPSRNSISARLNNNGTITLQRVRNTTTTTPVDVSIRSGSEIVNVTVNVTGTALSTNCP